MAIEKIEKKRRKKGWMDGKKIREKEKKKRKEKKKWGKTRQRILKIN